MKINKMSWTSWYIKLNCPLQQPIGGDAKAFRVLCLSCSTPMIELDRLKMSAMSRLSEISQIPQQKAKKCRNPRIVVKIHPRLFKIKMITLPFWIPTGEETKQKLQGANDDTISSNAVAR